VKDYMTRVGSDTEAVFNDAFWESINFVVNAVDNINARLYVDQRCVWYEKPLLESGTLGTKANSQMIVPHKTQCYGDSQDPPEEAIPMCTLRNFPNQIEHCIEWGRDKFNELFVDTPGDLIAYLDNPILFIAKLKNDATSSAAVASLKRISDFLKMKKANSFEACVLLAKNCFNTYYHHTILDLLSIFPKDHVDKEGSPFWSGPKRAPSHIEFDPKNKMHLEFVISYANLIATALKIQGNRDVAQVTELASKAPADPYVSKKIEVRTPEEEKANPTPVPQAATPEDEELIKALYEEIYVLKD
jgi:ubiquitin-activating enzyme E1